MRKLQPRGIRVLRLKSIGFAGGVFGVDQFVDDLTAGCSLESNGDLDLLDDLQWLIGARMASYSWPHEWAGCKYGILKTMIKPSYVKQTSRSLSRIPRLCLLGHRAGDLTILMNVRSPFVAYCHQCTMASLATSCTSV